MITEIIDFIAEQINLLNAGFFNSYSSNCLRIDGRVLMGFGNEKEDAGISDIKGRGFYIRYVDSLSYSDVPKKKLSGTKMVSVNAPLRLCFYDIKDCPVNPFLAEQKMRNDLMRIEEIGYKSDMDFLQKINLKSAIINNFEVIKDEFEKQDFNDAGITAECTLVVIDFNVTFESVYNPCLNLC